MFPPDIPAVCAFLLQEHLLAMKKLVAVEVLMNQVPTYITMCRQRAPPYLVRRSFINTENELASDFRPVLILHSVFILSLVLLCRGAVRKSQTPNLNAGRCRYRCLLSDLRGEIAWPGSDSEVNSMVNSCAALLSVTCLEMNGMNVRT